MKTPLDDAIACEIHRYFICWNYLSVISNILFIDSLQNHLMFGRPVVLSAYSVENFIQISCDVVFPFVSVSFCILTKLGLL